jgi:hypothetical protein
VQFIDFPQLFGFMCFKKVRFLRIEKEASPQCRSAALCGEDNNREEREGF